QERQRGQRQGIRAQQRQRAHRAHGGGAPDVPCADASRDALVRAGRLLAIRRAAAASRARALARQETIGPAMKRLSAVSLAALYPGSAGGAAPGPMPARDRAISRETMSWNRL